MRFTIYLSAILLTFYSFINGQESKNMNNPFFVEWKTPYGTPPFNEIKHEHFLPAIEEGIKLEKAEIDNIVNNQEPPTFKNTIEALETSGKFLERVQRVFEALNGANTNDELQKIARIITPMISKHNDDIYFNEKLFDRIKTIYENKKSLNLTNEQITLLENYYKNFVRNGANLNEKEKETLRKINEELSMLTLKFNENNLKETNAVALIIDSKEDLAGLPENVIKSAAETAKEKGYEGKWVFTLQRPSWIPFLQYSEKRQLREKLFKAYINRGNNNNEYDNKKILSRIISLRVQKANLLGYKTYADFVLERNMAKNPENVYKFLNDIWTPAIEKAKSEAAEMQKIIDKEGGNFKLQPWDWWYYAEKVKKEKYDLDEAMLRPYFKMENVRAGVFEVASKLYGIKFIERNDIPVYHPDVKVFEVTEADGKHIGIFYADYFPRDGKRMGAWSSSLRSQSNIDGNFITPLVYNVGNFSKPTEDKPSLMSIDEVNTLFHEFGHALHSLFANTTYQGSRFVPRDFVEFPSQIMENWAFEPEVLKIYAKHYQTGETIPQELIEKIQKSKLFNQGFETVEYLAAAFLDMDWHTLTDTNEQDVIAFEKKSLSKIGLIPEIESRYQSTNFLHIVGGYSAGYYSYIWSAVLDADAFQAFKETNLFDQKTANAFRNIILAKAGSEDLMTQYIKFRGREPKVDALLERRGLK
ncbi:M3 family metallopeptidase [Melioribacteraceae bacterium 4301-Me]|uniref:M3 family metallopeptidase n=1 Tax=Pyranulibacter aquaticus TaxID=3163344 RepID=UPI00359BC146